MADHCCSAKAAELEQLARQAEQRRVLQVVLAINAAMFVLEFGAVWSPALPPSWLTPWIC